MILCGARIQHNETRILDPAIGIFEAFDKTVLKRRTGRMGAQVERPAGWQDLATAKMVIDEQADPRQPGRAPAGQARDAGQHPAK